MGLCGLDGGMLKAVRRQEDGVDYGLVGDIAEVNPKVIQDAFQDGFIPVISPPPYQIIVPIPAWDSTSIRIEWGILPSRMWVLWTPF